MIRYPQTIRYEIPHTQQQKLTSFDGWDVGTDVGWDDGADVGCLDGACEGLMEGELEIGSLFGDFVGLDEGELVVGGISTLSMVWTTLLQAVTSKGEMTFDSLILIPVSVLGTPVVTWVVSSLAITMTWPLDNWELKTAALGTIWYLRISVSNGMSPTISPSPVMFSNASSVGAVGV